MDQKPFLNQKKILYLLCMLSFIAPHVGFYYVGSHALKAQIQKRIHMKNKYQQSPEHEQNQYKTIQRTYIKALLIFSFGSILLGMGTAFLLWRSAHQGQFLPKTPQNEANFYLALQKLDFLETKIAQIEHLMSPQFDGTIKE